MIKSNSDFFSSQDNHWPIRSQLNQKCHLVVYHDPRKMGYSVLRNPTKSFVARNPIGLQYAPCAWLITGEGDPCRFYLVAAFMVWDIHQGGPPGYPYIASGRRGITFDGGILIDEQPWFKDLPNYPGVFDEGIWEITYKLECLEGLFAIKNQVAEEEAEKQIREDTTLAGATKQALIDARRGQGLFRKRVMEIETHCRITGINHPSYLVACHCKPWLNSTNEERLDGNNGLLLAPHLAHLFNNGYLTFTEEGKPVISLRADKKALSQMGLGRDRQINACPLNAQQSLYMSYRGRMTFLSTVTFDY